MTAMLTGAVQVMMLELAMLAELAQVSAKYELRDSLAVV